MSKKYCYSWNNENYYGSFDTEQEAIEEAKEEYPDAKYMCIGTCKEPKIRWSSNEENIIESIMDNLYDDIGEGAENFEVSISEVSELARMIDETVELWIEQNKIKPSCYMVLDVHKVKLENGGSDNE